MTDSSTVLLFILIIAVTMAVSDPSNYPLIVLFGLLALGFWKYSTGRESFVDGDDAHIDSGAVTAETTQDQTSNVEPPNKNKWDNANVINKIFAKDTITTDGDQLLFEHGKHVGGQAKQAILNRARFTSDNFRPLYQEELDEQEHRDWWGDNDALDEQCVKDGEQW